MATFTITVRPKGQPPITITADHARIDVRADDVHQFKARLIGDEPICQVDLTDGGFATVCVPPAKSR